MPAMTTEQLVTHLRRETDSLERLVPGLRESRVAFVPALGVPLVDWALSDLQHHSENDALRIALEQVRGLLIGIAEVY